VFGSWIIVASRFEIDTKSIHRMKNQAICVGSALLLGLTACDPQPSASAGVVDADGTEYRTVKIGNQEWFAENLRTMRYRNGDLIPGDLNGAEWTTTEAGAQAVYAEGYSEVRSGSEDEEENLEVYGRLYNWYAVNDSRGLCPLGWHVPTDEDWTTLIEELGGEAVAGEHMKTNEWGGRNESGFSALPGGFRFNYGGSFDDLGNGGYWWSSSPSGSDAWYRYLSSGYSGVGRYYDGVRDGFSVRCVRD